MQDKIPIQEDNYSQAEMAVDFALKTSEKIRNQEIFRIQDFKACSAFKIEGDIVELDVGGKAYKFNKQSLEIGLLTGELSEADGQTASISYSESTSSSVKRRILLMTDEQATTIVGAINEDRNVTRAELGRALHNSVDSFTNAAADVSKVVMSPGEKYRQRLSKLLRQ
ncbi:hypothetical protein ACFL0C_00265 [Patescibacteria group bacterium]